MDVFILIIVLILAIPFGFFMAGVCEDLFTSKEEKERQQQEFERIKKESKEKERGKACAIEEREKRFQAYGPCYMYFPTKEDYDLLREYISDYRELIFKWAFEYYKVQNKIYIKSLNYICRDDNLFNDEKEIVECLLDTSSIISVSLEENGKQSTWTKGSVETDNGSLFARTAIGGIVAGGLGAAIGASTATKNVSTQTITNPKKKMIIIRTSDSAKSVVRIAPPRVAEAMLSPLYSILLDVVNSNKNVENDNSTSIADEIKKLADLKQQGIITEEEFTQQKTKILR